MAWDNTWLEVDPLREALREIELLREVRKMIEENRGHKYICITLLVLGDRRGRPDDLRADRLIAWIMSMLDGSETLETWHLNRYDRALENPRAARLAWIDWMIATIENEMKRKGKW